MNGQSIGSYRQYTICHYNFFNLIRKLLVIDQLLFDNSGKSDRYINYIRVDRHYKNDSVRKYAR